MRVSDQALNRLRILKAIRAHGPVSRTQLCAITGLAQATVSEITRDLIRRDLVCERREQQRRQGRPRIEMEINPDGGLVAGISPGIDGDVEINFINLKGEVTARWHGDMPSAQPLADYTDTLCMHFLAAVDATVRDGAAVTRIGVGLPALIDNDTGVVAWMATRQDETYPVRAMMEQRTGIATSVENDAYLLGRAEHWFGRASHVNDFLLVHVGLSISAIPFLDGLPLHGVHGFNAEIGHVKASAVAADHVCICGQAGCLNTLVSIVGILHAMGRSSLIPMPPFTDLFATFDQAVADALAGDEQAGRAFQAAGHELGRAIGNLINVLSLGQVFIVTRNAGFGELLRQPLLAAFAQTAFPPIHQQSQVEFLVEDPDWRDKGAAALALEQTYLGATPA